MSRNRPTELSKPKHNTWKVLVALSGLYGAHTVGPESSWKGWAILLIMWIGFNLAERVAKEYNNSK